MGLDEFLTGICAVLAFQGKQRIHLETGVFDVALVKTLELLSKQIARDRLEPMFRLTKASAAQPRSALNRAVKRLIDQGIMAKPSAPGAPARIIWHPSEAYRWLATTAFEVGFFERAGKLFWKQHETARIRFSLHRLATRSSKTQP